MTIAVVIDRHRSRCQRRRRLLREPVRARVSPSRSTDTILSYFFFSRLIANESYDALQRMIELNLSSYSRFNCDTHGLKRSPATGISRVRSSSHEASEPIGSTARYVTSRRPRIRGDHSTVRNEVRRYTRGYPREKSIHDPPLGHDSDARGYMFLESGGSPLRAKRRVGSLRILPRKPRIDFSTCVRVYSFSSTWKRIHTHRRSFTCAGDRSWSSIV